MNIKAVLLTILVLGLILPVSASPGALDLFFGNNGIATAPIGKGSFEQVFAAALQPDGKVVIAGESQSNSLTYHGEPANFIVSRINTDGSLDTSFGYHGIATKRFGDGCRATSMLIQPDGKIVIGGYTFKDYGQPTGYKKVMMLIRLNSNGSIDTSFGTAGLVITELPSNQQGQINSLALQSDGKIVAAGYMYFASTLAISMTATRYNTNGSADTGFDGDGIAFVDINPAGNQGRTVAVQTDGKIVIGGQVRETTGTITDFGLARLNTDGSLDTSFDGDGKLTTKFTTTSSTVAALRIQSDGKIVAAGSSIQGSLRDIALARYNTDGSLDNTFDGDGKVVTDFGNEISGGVTLQADGKIVVCGQASLAGELFSLLTVRYNTDGSLDNTFDGDGKVLTAVPNLFSKANAVIVNGDGKIIIAGHAQTFEEADFALARYNADGSPDTAFDSDGLTVIEPANSADSIGETALQQDGKIVALGESFGGFYLNIGLTRFTRDGTLDTGFGSGGSVTLTFPGSDAFPNDVLIQPDGKILAAVQVVTDNKYITYRFNPDGTPDNTFGTAGLSTVQAGTVADYPTSMALQPDGKIVLAGTSDGDVTGPSMVRLNANGSLDPTFGNAGRS